MRLNAIYCAAGLFALVLGGFTTAARSQADDRAGKLRPSISFDLGSVNVKKVLRDGKLTWLGTSDGLIRFDNLTGEQRTYNNKSGLLSNGVFYVGKFDGRIWVGTYGGGLSILDPSTQVWTHYNITDGLGDSFVYDVMRDPRGDIWIATWSGVNQVVGGALQDSSAWRLHTVASTKSGLANDWVYGLASGPDGAVWLATEGGLTRYRDGVWTSWKHADGLGAPWERVAGEDKERAAASVASRHHQRQRQEQGLERTGPAYNPNYVVSLAVDTDGVVWAGTWGAGLSRFDGATWRSFTMADGLPGNHVFSLAISGRRIWIGTNRGLASFDGKAFHKLIPESGLIVSSVFAIAIGEESAWIGGYGGATWYPRGIEAVLSGKKGDEK
jgi:ligand-binding sensor domain-containing protein